MITLITNHELFRYNKLNLLSIQIQHSRKMKISTVNKIHELPCQEQWSNHMVSCEGGKELSSVFLRSIEQAFSSDFQFKYITAYNSCGALVFVCPVYISPNINLEFTLPDSLLKKFIFYWRKLDRRILSPRVLFIGTPLNDELDINVDNVNEKQEKEIFDLFVNKLFEIRRDYSCQVIIFKNLLSKSWLDKLSEHGFFCVESLPNSIVKCDFSSFSEFLNSLDARKRRNINSKLKKATAIGYNVQVKEGNEYNVANGFQLFENNYLKSEHKFERLNISLFYNLVNNLGEDVIWISIYKNNFLVASAICYIENKSLVMKRVGINYSSPIPFLYFILHYETIKYAIQKNLKFIKLGPTAYEAKKEMGAYLQTTYLFVQHRNLILNKILQIFYSFVC
jgi:predicted N-acyltransferase